MPALQPQPKIITIEQYEALPKDQRAEVFDGVIYDMSSPSQIHQSMLLELITLLNSYVKKHNGNCKVFPAPFDVKLSTYAVPYILGEIKRFIRDDGSVKVSRSIKELSVKIRDIQNKCLKEEGREATLQEISKELKVNKEEITLALDSLMPTVSIYENTYNDDEDGISFIDTLSTNVDEQEQLVNKLTIKNILEQLNEREKQIILLRYFKNRTQTEVAKILGISQVQVSRIEKKTLKQIKVKL